MMQLINWSCIVPIPQWRSSSPPEEEEEDPFGATPKQDKETSPAKMDGKGKSSRKGSKSSNKGKDAPKKEEEEPKPRADGTKKDPTPLSSSQPSKPATQPPQTSSLKDAPTTQTAIPPATKGKKTDAPPHPQTDSASSRPLSLIAGTAECSDYCYFCYKRVYLMERMSANGLYFHRNCFKCTHCKMQLGVGGYALSKGEGAEKGKFFCTAHYRQLFLSNPEAINYSRANPGSSARPTPTSTPIPEEPQDDEPQNDLAQEGQRLEQATPSIPPLQNGPMTAVRPVVVDVTSGKPHGTLSLSLGVQPTQPQQPPAANQANVALGETEVPGSKSGQRSPAIKPSRPAPPPPAIVAKATEKEATPKMPEKGTTREAVVPKPAQAKEVEPAQASPKMPQKPPPYRPSSGGGGGGGGGGGQRSSVADLAQQCISRDGEVVGRSRVGSGLPVKSTVLSPTRGEWEGRVDVWRREGGCLEEQVSTEQCLSPSYM